MNLRSPQVEVEYKGAISNGPRFTNRTTQYVDLGLNTSWKPQVVPCGQTLYYGASEGNAGDQWVANETAINGPALLSAAQPVPGDRGVRHQSSGRKLPGRAVLFV